MGYKAELITGYVVVEANARMRMLSLLKPIMELRKARLDSPLVRSHVKEQPCRTHITALLRSASSGATCRRAVKLCSAATLIVRMAPVYFA